MATAPPQPHFSLEQNYLIFETGRQLYSLPSARLIQIIDLPVYTIVPNMLPSLRGVFDFRGKAVPLYDLRKILGHISKEEEIANLISTLAQRKQDHLNWLTKLKDSVCHQTEITVETNHHRCAFGKWYDTFTTDSAILGYYLSRFDKPHQRIHRLAEEAKELMSQGRPEAAQAMIRAAEGKELKILLDLFDNAGEQITKFSYEYAIVLEHDGEKVGLTVDSLKYFGKFDAISSELPAVIANAPDNLVEAIGRRYYEETTEEVMMLRIDRLLAVG